MTSKELRDRFSGMLRAWMSENGATTRSLAEAVGVSSAAPQRWATGGSLPRAYELRCLCEATGMSADELLGLDR